MKRNIDDQIRDYYASQQPSPESIERMKRAIASGAELRRPRRSWVAAAVLFVLLSSALIWNIARDANIVTQDLGAFVMRQAAIGHNEKQELEFRVRECKELQSKMKSLDFTPVEPAMMQQMKMRIIGARYTTINGRIAAQIVYVDSSGTRCTVYEVRPADGLGRLSSAERQVDGVHVALWQEKGLLILLARPIA